MDDKNKQISNINFRINKIEIEIDRISLEIENSLDRYEKEIDPLLKDRCFIIYQSKVQRSLGLQNEKVELQKQINMLLQSKGKY